MSHEINLFRYSRQLPILGLEGQHALQKARVLVVGAGGLGCPALLYLISAGVGNISIIDGDRVDLSNLHRQILFDETMIGINKATAAVKRLQAINSACQLQAYSTQLNEDNALKMMSNQDIIVDATDNFSTRYLINTICRQRSIPLVTASIFQFDAQLTVLNYRNGPCLECLYPAPPPEHAIPNCAEGGILGAVAGAAGTLQALEVIKILCNQGEVLSGKLLTMNLLSHEYRCFPVKKKPSCKPSYCSDPKLSELLATAKLAFIEPLALADALKSQAGNYYLIDVRQPYEREICHIGGELIPLADLKFRLNEIPKDKTIVTYCKMGARSQQAASLLLENEFSKVFYLQEGILGWIKKVDDQLTAY